LLDVTHLAFAAEFLTLYKPTLYAIVCV